MSAKFPRGGGGKPILSHPSMQFVIVIFPNHTQLLYLGVIHANRYGFGESAHLLGLVLAIVLVQNSYVVAQMAIECQFVRAAEALASLHICTD